MIIYIPTKGRGPHRQHTYEALVKAGVTDKYPVWLLVADEEEYEQFSRAKMPVTIHHYGPGIRASRQFVLDSAPDKVLMLDDDLNNWAERVETGGMVKFFRDDTAPLFAVRKIEALLDTYTHAAIGHRQMANTQPLVNIGGRALRALAYRADIVRELGLRYELPVMEDFEMTLKLLTRGHPNAIFYGVVQDQKGSDMPGGCQGLRTLELHNECAMALAAMFPDYVKLKEVGGWDLGTRLDVTVQWKKALKHGN